METVEVVVKIPKKKYDVLMETGDCSLNHNERAIKHGTVLPKGHGDLKDMDDLCYKSRYGCKGHCDYLHTCNLYDAPTVVAADKEIENE